jgi:hypothetical protein
LFAALAFVSHQHHQVLFDWIPALSSAEWGKSSEKAVDSSRQDRNSSVSFGLAVHGFTFFGALDSTE